ncbi:hypothetical protein PFICI_01543 [Pestalotiopsis fici W106-1]|uniref:WLM domain-containing protein n=1 Tax=Pestalotiopsis fici (strain W106-1 / CGMCC3.15140) TaxID=1229662 RepID=W3XP27_PESFW|nr:uncharacterized protein PFICI_01543 [Pestalotiopsis fici W106-1]ETS87715.1 hypothetical protein PFICI_01543 [Pestalotiopsis fici W106-1]
MPLGIQRLNARKLQPNPHINFIKPLRGPDEAVAQDFLERIAAQCVPVMREHHISVMSLEEFEPNREFVGRNFNAGEVIQLVLKSPSTGRWLPFNYVQMVMMHELAHCKQMNHSRAFWAVRNKYAEQMRHLWTNKYTGEGLWGPGHLLSTGQFEFNTVLADEVLPEHTCGGTYRSRRPKRKAKDQLSYQQRKERRILKKFGANGVALGEDEVVKSELEGGKKTQGKPRVAKSKRGRDLRAAAALARFDQQKKAEEEETKQQVKAEDETDSDDDFDVASEGDFDEPDALDINGKKLLDNNGQALIKVCEDENPEDGDAQNELRELQSSMIVAQSNPSRQRTAIKQENETDLSLQDLPSLEKPTKPGGRELQAASSKQDPVNKKDGTEKTARSISQSILRLQTPKEGPALTATTEVTNNESSVESVRCPMCSTENGPISLTCSVCSHVLDMRKDPKAWACTSVSCQGSQYRNAGDNGVCGVCGSRKATC